MRRPYWILDPDEQVTDELAAAPCQPRVSRGEGTQRLLIIKQQPASTKAAVIAFKLELIGIY